ncbi:hypothetical protein B0H11DRAFT_2094045 [Mycena galericulata]|nr:hypothetical protein B0H11DRAFT_2094045 [Mycena galericulata]
MGTSVLWALIFITTMLDSFAERRGCTGGWNVYVSRGTYLKTQLRSVAGGLCSPSLLQKWRQNGVQPVIKERNAPGCGNFGKEAISWSVKSLYSVSIAEPLSLFLPMNWTHWGPFQHNINSLLASRCPLCQSSHGWVYRLGFQFQEVVWQEYSAASTFATNWAAVLFKNEAQTWGLNSLPLICSCFQSACAAPASIVHWLTTCNTKRRVL